MARPAELPLAMSARGSMGFSCRLPVDWIIVEMCPHELVLDISWGKLCFSLFVCIVGLALWFSRNHWAHPPQKPTLDELVTEYRAHGLPLPPKDAKLVKLTGSSTFGPDGRLTSTVYSLGLQIKPAIGKNRPLVLQGIDDPITVHPDEVRIVEPDPAILNDIQLRDEIPLAIQCRSCGWIAISDRIFEKRLNAAEDSPRQILSKLAWTYWQSQLTQPKIDRAPVAIRLKDLIRQNDELNTEPNLALIRSLEFALVKSDALPGTVRALIDDLVDYETNASTHWHHEPEERYWRIARLGFDAVPDLIEHLHDERLTRARMEGFNNFRTWNLRVGNIVGDLLENLAGEELMRGTDAEDVGGGWLRRQQGFSITTAAAKDWWEKARKVGERAYVLKQVFPSDDDCKEGRIELRHHSLKLIAAKYPDQIPVLYRTVLEKETSFGSWRLADAVQALKMPDRDKFDLFVKAAKHDDRNHRLPALRALRQMDKKLFDALVLDEVRNFRGDIDGEYWSSHERFVAGLVIDSENAQIWQVLKAKAKNASVGMRLELLNHFSYRDEKRHWVERLDYLGSFLEDDELRDLQSSKKFEGPCAGSIYKKIKVRDFVALELSRMLGIEIETKLARSAEEWQAIRTTVREALKREQR